MAIKKTIADLDAEALPVAGTAEIAVQSGILVKKIALEALPVSDLVQAEVDRIDGEVSTLNSTTVKLTGDQSIDGVKTFTSSPIVPTLSQGDNSTKSASTAYVDVGLASVGVKTQATITTNYTAIATDENIFVNTASAITISLPDALSVGKEYTIVRLISGGNITIDTVGSDTINGAASFIFYASSQYTAVRIKKASATEWAGARQETPTVRAEYTGSNAIVPTTSETVINFATVVEDTHGSVSNPSTDWTFTVPVAGLYTINLIIEGASVGGAVGYNITHRLSGTLSRSIGRFNIAQGVGTESSSMHGPVRYSAGQTIKLSWTSNITTVANATARLVIIARVGA